MIDFQVPRWFPSPLQILIIFGSIQSWTTHLPLKNPQVVECLSSLSTNLKFKWFLYWNFPCRTICDSMSLQVQLSTPHLPPAASPDGSWCGAHSEAHDEWPGVKNVTGRVSFCLPISGFEGFQRWSNMFFSPEFLSVVLFHEYRCFKKLFESLKATSYMYSCWLQTRCDVARKYGVEHYCLEIISWLRCQDLIRPPVEQVMLCPKRLIWKEEIVIEMVTWLRNTTLLPGKPATFLWIMTANHA